MSDDELSELDIAAVNLACATGLPGSDGMDVPALLHKLDRWAELVRAETAKYAYRYQQNSADYDDSLGQFRILMMITVLQQDLGVRYHPDRVRNVDFKRSEDLFLHGLLDGDGGTCCSMPVLYVAIGRRLGYPLQLVEGPEHLFVRWEDGATGERFNIEATSRGFLSEPDEYYTKWPRRMTPSESAVGYFLKSLTPREALATFITTRAHALNDLDELEQAEAAYSTALQLSPSNIPANVWVRRTIDAIGRKKHGTTASDTRRQRINGATRAAQNPQDQERGQP